VETEMHSSKTTSLPWEARKMTSLHLVPNKMKQKEEGTERFPDLLYLLLGRMVILLEVLLHPNLKLIHLVEQSHVRMYSVKENQRINNHLPVLLRK